MTLKELEQVTGISKTTLGKYESDNCTDISPFNLAKLAEYYGLSMDYLMGLTENKKHPNTSLYELHLDDAVVDLLKSKMLNNRLLCELICHPDFPCLMADIEICIDRIADMRINDLNLVLEQARQVIMEQYQPPENDLYMRTLERGQVSSELFFGHVIHNDLDAIVKDLRDRHASDKTTAEPETAPTVKLSNLSALLFDALKYRKSPDEMRAFTICHTLDIDYENLPESDRKALVRVFKSSKTLTTATSQRGKTKSVSLFGRGKKKE